MTRSLLQLLVAAIASPLLWSPAAASLPQVVTPIPPQDVRAASIVVIDLADHFDLAGVSGPIMRVSTTSGDFNMELLDEVAPATVQNFLNYRNAGAYMNTLVHRSVPGFIVQTGGFTATLPPQTLTTSAPVINEYNLSNTRGTVAMAKLGGDPNSATNQWFVNLADNGSNLDSQNGGFTVFARVLGSGMSVVDTIAAVPVYNAGSPFDEIPLRDMEEGQQSVLPKNLVAVLSVTPVAVYPDGGPSVLSFSVGNSHPGIISASLSGTQLTLTRVPGATGTASITVQATDTNGNTVAETFDVADTGVQAPIAPTPGVYTGLVGNGQVGSGSAADRAAFSAGNGFVTLTVRANRAFTGSLRLEGKAIPIRGMFDAFGQAVVTAKRKGQPDLTVAMEFPNQTMLTGMAAAGGPALPFIALPSSHTGKKGDTHPLAKTRYSILLPSPDPALGHGYATTVFDAKGVAKTTGKLADGTRLTCSAATSDPGDGFWLAPCYAPIHVGAQGMLWGEIRVPKADSNTIAGDLGWLRPENQKLFQTALLEVIEAVGARYMAPPKGISLLSGSATSADFSIIVDPAENAGTSFSPAGTWPMTNKPIVLPNQVPVTKITFTATTGLFKGSFVRVVAGKKVNTSYEGVVFSSPLTPPNADTPLRGGGFFSSGGANGAVELNE